MRSVPPGPTLVTPAPYSARTKDRADKLTTLASVCHTSSAPGTPRPASSSRSEAVTRGRLGNKDSGRPWSRAQVEIRQGM